jgi:hypothetical protein
VIKNINKLNKYDLKYIYLDYNKINYKNRKNKTYLEIDGMYHGGGGEEKKRRKGRRGRKEGEERERERERERQRATEVRC